MEHISDLLNVDFLNIKREELKQSESLDPHAKDLVNKLFGFFFAICRGFEKQYHDPQRLSAEKTQWVMAFNDIGYNSLENIHLGIKKCRLETPINTPTIGQFISWCKLSPDDLGLWTKEQAYKRVFPILRKEAIDISDDQSAIINHAIKETGIYDLKNHSESKTRPLFEHNYEIAVRDFLSGKLKPIPKALEDQRAEILELSKQEEIKKKHAHLIGYADCMPEIRKILGMNPNGIINTQ